MALSKKQLSLVISCIMLLSAAFALPLNAASTVSTDVFSATPGNDVIYLKWSMALGPNDIGYMILKGTEAYTGKAYENGKFKVLDFSLDQKGYTDNDVENGIKYYYYLMLVNEKLEAREDTRVEAAATPAGSDMKQVTGAQPGTYAEEHTSIADIPSEPAMIEGLEASVAGFLGEAERGPADPRLLNSWEEYSMLYGESKNVSSYLPYAVRGFFENGGRKLYVARIVDKAAVAAAVRLYAGKTPVMTLRAIGEGSWGNRLQVKVSEASESSKDNQMFRLEIYYWDTIPSSAIYNLQLNKLKISPSVTEVFDNLSMDQKSENYYEYKINGNSKLITVYKEAGELGIIPDSLSVPSFLNGGSDGGSLALEDYIGDEEAGLNAVRGLAALDAIDEISMLYCPDTLSIAGLAHELIQHCENLTDRMVILDSQRGDTDPMHDEEFNSSYAAFYYPWIMIDGALEGTQLLVPPGGQIAGIYALTEAQRGINKAPAAMVVKGAKGLEFSIDDQRQGILNLRSVNTIREFSGRGILVWGARTLAAQNDPEYRYVNVRRLKNYLEESIREGLTWTGNWYNDQQLWMRVEPCIRNFLTAEWRKGCLMGTRERDAFFVKVDRSTMNQTDVEEGRLIIQIGVAMVRPAEFQIIRIMLPVKGSN